MIRLMLGFVAAVAMTGGARAQSRGRARQLSGQHHPDLRQLPYAAGAAAACSTWQAAFRRAATWDEPTFKVKGSNITPDKDTGIGNWTDAEIKKALQQGVRPNGTPIAPIMPFGFYKIFTPGDLDAVVAYLNRCRPVKNKVPPPVYKAAMHAEACRAPTSR